MKKRLVLLTPGPTPVPPEALELMSQPIFHHRTPQYQAIFGRVSQELKKIFVTKNNVYTLTSSGTGAMEASVVNFLSPGDKVIVAHAGKFGERWVQLAKQYGMTVLEIKAEYGRAVAAETIAETLKKNHDIKAVYTTLCETSTGVCYDIQLIAQATASSDAILIVDAISGLGADRMPQDEWGVDVVVSGSQKALMLPPGLAFLSVSDKAKKKMAEAKCPRYYYDLRLYEKALTSSDTPFTPALTLVLALEATLKILLTNGLEAHLNDTAQLAEATRAGVKALGLSFFAKERPSNGLTSIEVPAGVDGSKLVKIMRDEKGVTMAGGQGSMKGQIFRMAHMGFIGQEDLRIGFSVLTETLNALGYRCDAQKVLDAFNDVAGSKKVKQ
ncbi:MAG: aminotransferase [Candidatus Omnitrophica bacterium CG11_big_fil_rev_8_21_14_0_20_45_26]|uniref:Aminotransferase n=1 Tax=Candidatus Abzuiibacterium crystallinum TaxID=1974748 RepID=A0A2H0LT13_9BACT|nr:MAG: aminotransferase [Candidatus Omnitrophica bacterium CG11_big_fil_rev_8_21_14_0_20_45_26]PIW65460.1 MAG: aminotransferase [Candidatus Omnitrophica bacterium CG12_big_fil_rev_8_21_14_0_65_45_16]